MKIGTWKSRVGPARQIVWNLALISLGSSLCALALNGILIPRQFLSGGLTGLVLIIHYLLPVLPVGGVYFLLNIPIFALGWKFVGLRFFLYSIVGLVCFSGALFAVNVTLPVHDQFLSALLAGIITGIGAGIILKSLGSAGGTDILSVILLKRFSIRLGTTVLAFNIVILAGAALLFSLDKALYTLIYLYVSSQLINLVVTGLSQRKAVHIISPKWDLIAREILDKIGRGVTITTARGGYTGRKVQTLYTVITFRELSRIKQVVRNIDPNAFVVVTDTLEVMGHRIGNQPHW
jgi:uncharacterized membrane-anchored protein YitT (DUF2179 family)